MLPLVQDRLQAALAHALHLVAVGRQVSSFTLLFSLERANLTFVHWAAAPYFIQCATCSKEKFNFKNKKRIE